MTAPMHTDSDRAAIQSLGFRDDQLERRPTPSTSLSSERAVLSYSGAAVVFDGTPTYDANEVIAWTYAASFGPSFSQYTDGNGDVGISNGPGMYIGYAYCHVQPEDTGASNPGRLIPPTVQFRINTVPDDTSDFAPGGVASDSAFVIPSVAIGWQSKSDDGAELNVPADDTVANRGYLLLGGAFVDGVIPSQPFKGWSGAIMSSGGANQWSYNDARVFLFRLGDFG